MRTSENPQKAKFISSILHRSPPWRREGPIESPLGWDARAYMCFGVDEDAHREHSRAALRPMGESQNTQPLELRFRALLTEATTEMQLALVWRIRILAAGAPITSNSLPSAPIL